MSLLKIVNYGNEILRRHCEEITKVTDPDIQKLIKNMLDSMYAENGVGLAAPQVGVNKQLFIVDTARENEPRNPKIFINPKIIKYEGAMISHEGCLSFPNVYLDIKRYARIVIRAKDERGRMVTTDALGFSLLARAIQHEFDHLLGVLFIDHAVDLQKANEVLHDFGFMPIEMEKQITSPDLDAILKADIESVILNNKEEKEIDS